MENSMDKILFLPPLNYGIDWFRERNSKNDKNDGNREVRVINLFSICNSTAVISDERISFLPDFGFLFYPAFSVNKSHFFHFKFNHLFFYLPTDWFLHFPVPGNTRCFLYVTGIAFISFISPEMSCLSFI